jgi:CRISPR-associated endonuclease/helicase Cas3
VEVAGLSRARLRPGSFEQEFPRFTPNALQKSVAETLPGLSSGPGLLLMMAPMGIGKTETALHAARVMGDASGASGLFVTLPTMATADQMYTRVREYAARRLDGDAALTLLHSMAWLNTAYAPSGPRMTAAVGTAAVGTAGRRC